jgi:hypothetical protein
MAHRYKPQEVRTSSIPNNNTTELTTMDSSFGNAWSHLDL